MLLSFVVLCLLAINSCNAQNWVKIPGGTCIQVSAKSDALYFRSIHDFVYTPNWATGKWITIKGGNFKALGATPDGYIWTTITDYKPRRLDAAKNAWEYPGNSKEIPKLRNINAISKDNAIAADVNNDIWTFRNNEWVKQGGNMGMYAAMGTDGDRWTINDQGRIFRLESGGWIEKSTPYSPSQTPNKYQIDVQNADRVIVTNGQLAYVLREYSWSEKNFYKKWDAIDGYARSVSINQTHIFRVSNEVVLAGGLKNYAVYYAAF